jgi:hypothetical protein
MTTTQPVMMNARIMASEVRLGTLFERRCILGVWSRDCVWVVTVREGVL